MRKSRKNMILAGLWCGSAKPSMNIFLDPMCKTSIDLEKGVEVTTFSKATVLVQRFLLVISCDLPARSTVLNINQHNGEGCCIKCLQLGKNHRTETGGNIRVFDYCFTEIVDMRLEEIKPPHTISRKPRSISEHLKFWKASELRSWFFYYSIPCIADLLPPVYLYHYCTFVVGIFLLCTSSISTSDIEKSEELLRYFVFKFSSLYAEKYLTINIHSLLQLPQTVCELGSLWAFSCFSFEDANGELLQLFHGTQNIDLQIVNAVHVFQMLPLMSQSISNRSIASDFVKKLSKFQESADVSQFCLLGKSY